MLESVRETNQNRAMRVKFLAQGKKWDPDGNSTNYRYNSLTNMSGLTFIFISM